MKKFIMFLVIVVSIVSLGLTIYYFSIDNEAIYVKNSYLVVDKNETIDTDGLLVYKNKDSHTQYSYSSSNEAVLSFTDGKYVAGGAGNCTIIINTSNRFYSRLTIEVRVCDGSRDFPYEIATQEKLRKIGKDPAYPKDAYYVLADDIYLTNIVEDGHNLGATWSPIESFSGSFDGAFHTIYNMSINDATLGENNHNAGFIGTLESVSNVEGGTSSMAYTSTSGSNERMIGVVKNVLFKNVFVNVTQAYNVGSVVGLNLGEVHTCEAEGTIKAGGIALYIGGVVGANSDLYAERTIIDRCGYTGGIYATDATNATIGGVVGYTTSGSVSESYYITGEENNSIANGNNIFGGIVGVNSGDSIKANIYDNYFYMKSVAVDREGDEPVTLTNNTLMAGVVYSDRNSETTNNVYGNYYGGNDALSSVVPVIEGAVNSRFNSYLTVAEFASHDLEQTKFVNIITRSEGTKIWAFGSVWSMGDTYPILDIHSPAGSVYTDNPDDVLADTEISNATEFIDAITGNGYYASRNFKITVPVIDLEGMEFGSTEHPIPNYLLGVSGDNYGALISDIGTVVKNFTLVNTEEDANVGLARHIAKNVTVRGITFENVNFTGDRGKYVGVLAGKSEGANISAVSVKKVTCSIDGTAFGGIVGLANTADGHAFSFVSATNVDCENSRFIYAGGIVGYNYANIIGSKENPVIVNIVKLGANYSGGIVGTNIYGNILNVLVSNMTFNKGYDGNTQEGEIYSGSINISGNGDVLIGGIAGRNYGTISGAYANSYVTAYAYDSTLCFAEYGVYVGGITGTNNGNIASSYVFSTNLRVVGSSTVVMGGLAGTNYGIITTSFVDSDTSLVCDTAVSVPPTENNSVVWDGVTMAGGLVGYDDKTTNSYSIYRCVSQAKKVQAFYSAGLVAVEFGKMMQCSCGDDTVSGGKMDISGFMTSGLSVFIRFGYVKDCYGFVTLSTVTSSEIYSGIKSIVGRRVSGSAGIALVADTEAVVRGCYVLVTFDKAEGSQTFGGFGSTSGSHVTGCVYVTAGSQSSSAGVRLTLDELRGTDSFAKFISSIGSEDAGIWSYNFTYPVISAIDPRNPDRVIPSYTF